MSDEPVIIEIVEEIPVISEEAAESVLIEQIEEVTLLETYDGAPPGSAAETVENITAGAALSAYKMIVPNSAGSYIYADSTNLDHASIVYGITRQAISSGATGSAQTYGPVENNTWTWDLNKPLYLSTAGEITQEPPSTGFFLVIGYPITATKIFLRIGEPIFLQ